MRTQRHHKIPRSRGGSDDDWNLVDKSEYDHAYSHALDFVLFDTAPWMDCRMKGYSSLPDDLKEAVRQEHSKRMSARNRKMVQEGTHPMLQDKNKKAKSEECKSPEVLKRLEKARAARTSEGLAKGGRASGPANGRNAMSQKWRCLETGKVTNAAALARYQKARNIDTSKRERIS